MPGASTSSSTDNTTGSSTPTQIAQLKAGFTGAQGALGTANANAATTQPAGFTAQMTPQQLAAYQSVYGNANGNTSATTEQNNGALAGTAGAAGIQGALNGYAGFNPTMSGITDVANQYRNAQDIPGQVKAAMLGANQEANDVTLPGIDSAAAGSGNTNSSRTGIASGIVQRGLAQQAGGLTAQLGQNAWSTGAQVGSDLNNQRIAALGGQANAGIGGLGAGTGALSSGVNDQGTLGGQLLTGASGNQQNQQLGFNNQNQAFQFGQNSPFAGLQNYMNLLNVNAGGTTAGTSDKTSTPSFMQTVGSLLGAGGSALGSKGGPLGGASGILGAASLFSDRRLKQDIEQVGLLFDGTPVYRYRYIGQPQMQIGVMAQDIEEFAPEAINEFHGYKMVDYEKATQRSLGHAGGHA